MSNSNNSDGLLNPSTKRPGEFVRQAPSREIQPKPNDPGRREILPKQKPQQPTTKPSCLDD